jgi:hypothetical protein
MRARQHALRLERRRVAGGTSGERFVGYGLMSLAFESGDVLAFRRCTASSIGPPYVSIWHREPAGRWTFHTNVDPLRSCPRFFDSGLGASHSDDIEVRWTSDRDLVVAARRARLQLALRLVATPVTALLTAGAQRVARPLWSRPAVARGLGAAAAALLDSGELALNGMTPAGYHFTARPRSLWRVAGAAAVLGGRDPGAVVPLPERVLLADFVLPRNALLVMGGIDFHHVTRAPGEAV